MFRNQRRIPGEVLLLGIPLSFFGLLFFYPLGAIVQRTVFPDGHLELSFVWQILSDRYLRGVLSFTVGQALLSAILTVGLGLPLGYLLGRYRFRGRHLCMVLFTIPFMLPAVVVAVGFRSLFGPGTILGNAVPIATFFPVLNNLFLFSGISI